MSAVPKSVWQTWEKSGREEFIKLCLAAEVVPTGTSDTFPGLFLELIERIAKKTIDAKSAAVAARKAIGRKPNLLYRFLDAVHGIDSIHPSPSEGSKEETREVLVSFVQEILPAISGCEHVLRVRLDLGLLSDVGLLKNTAAFQTRLIRAKTKLFFKQQKYNLLREETEGYSKLLVHLCQDFSETNADELVNIMRSLIGYFNLDPNRVIQLILNVLELRSGDARATELLLNVLRAHVAGEKAAIAEFSGWALKARADVLSGEATESDFPFDDDAEDEEGEEGMEVEEGAKKRDKSGGQPKEEDRTVAKHPVTHFPVEDEFQRYRMVALLIKHGFLDVMDVRSWVRESRVMRAIY